MSPWCQEKKNSLDTRGKFAEMAPHVVLETNISMMKGEGKICMAATESELPTYDSYIRVGD